MRLFVSVLAALSLTASSPNPPAPAAHAAPAPVTGGQPDEARLTPPPEAEKVQLPAGFVEVPNPAFPPTPVLAVDVKRGRRYEAREFTLYFGAGTLAEAKAALDGGHLPHALELLEGQGDAPPVRYLRGLVQLRAGMNAAAALTMTGLAQDYPAMRDRCLAHAALAQELQQHWREAQTLFGQILPTSRLFPDARFGLARTLRHQGDLAGAIEALTPVVTLQGGLWGRDVSAEALIVRADLAKEKKDVAVERENLLKLWSLRPLSALAKQAERRLSGVKIPSEAQVTRAEALIEIHRNKQGMKILEPMLPKLKLPDALACRAHFAYGKALRKEREHSKAQAVLQPVASECKTPDLRARVLYVLGSSQSIIDYSRGVITYETLAHDYPAHAFADDALFFAADLYSKNGDFPAALKQLEALERLYPTGDFYAEALFKTFWIHRARDEKPEALRVLDQIEKDLLGAEESYDVERARYWRARMADEAGNPEEALGLYQNLALEHPTTYYGLISRDRLREKDVKRAAVVDAKIAQPVALQSPWPMYAAASLGQDPHFLAGVELVRLGYPDAASSELLGVNRSGQSAESLRLLVQVIAASGDFRSAHAIARVSLRRDLGGPIRPETRSLWELAYPYAFRELIEKHCKAASLDPDLLQALMREESALDPKALSWAGALGLTQLMLPTAKGTAVQLKLKTKITQEALLEPDLNIQLGAAYLGKLMQRFQGNRQYSLAGYNAGAGAVEKWRSERRNLALDEWVEEIPIAETRGYVKRVLRTYNTYRLLYGKRPPTNGPLSQR